MIIEWFVMQVEEFLFRLCVLKLNHIEIKDSINQKFVEISNRHATFNNMSIDEKLAEIANLIENLLKRNEKFVKLDYFKISFPTDR